MVYSGNDPSYNYLETTRGFFALQAFFKRMSNIHVRLELDNTTAVTYINKMSVTVIGQCGSCGCGILSIIFECQQCIYQGLKILRLIDNPKFLMSTQNGPLVIPFLFKSAKSFFTPTTVFFHIPFKPQSR